MCAMDFIFFIKIFSANYLLRNMMISPINKKEITASRLNQIYFDKFVFEIKHKLLKVLSCTDYKFQKGALSQKQY